MSLRSMTIIVYQKDGNRQTTHLLHLETYNPNLLLSYVGWVLVPAIWTVFVGNQTSLDVYTSMNNKQIYVCHMTGTREDHLQVNTLLPKKQPQKQDPYHSPNVHGVLQSLKPALLTVILTQKPFLLQNHGILRERKASPLAKRR
jgi:hypothetical protein